MAGYRIEYSGAAVQRKDVPQATGNSSLTQSALVSPTSWDGQGSGTNLIPYNSGDFTAGGNPGVTYRYYHPPGVAVTMTWSGGVFSFPIGSDDQFKFITPAIGSAGTFSYRIGTNGSYVTGSGAFPSGAYIYIELFTLFGGGILTIQWFIFNGPSAVIYSGTFGAGAGTAQIDYMNVTTNSAISITPSTFTNGVAPTGGSAVTPTVTTTQAGVGATSGAPKQFGTDVKHNGITILRPRYLPPADNSQGALASVSQSKIITATATTLSVEATGLGGPEKLKAADTSVIVENLENATEN